MIITSLMAMCSEEAEHIAINKNPRLAFLQVGDLT